MPQSLYTPFGEAFARNITGGLAAGRQNLQQAAQRELAGAAYQGDEQALADLFRQNPELANKINQQKLQQQQLSIQGAAKQQAAQARMADTQSKIQGRQRQFFMDNRKVIEDVMKKAASIENFEEAESFVERKIEENKPLLGAMADSFRLTRPAFAQLKHIYKSKESTPFAGKAMDAQVSNILIKGVDDPGFRSSPIYRRAWDIATQPKQIQTPTGTMNIIPQVDPDFKPPSQVVPTVQAAPSAPVAAEKLKPLEAPIKSTPVPTTQEGIDELAKKSEEMKLEAPSGAPFSARYPIQNGYMIKGTEKISLDQRLYNKDYMILKKSYLSMRDYLDLLEESGIQVSLGRFNVGKRVELDAAYTVAELDAKETNKLGVINGPDLMLLERILLKPTQASGLWYGEKGALSGAKVGMKQIMNSLTALNEVFEGTPVDIRDITKVKTQAKGDRVEGLDVWYKGKKSTFPDKKSLNAWQAARAKAGF